MGGEVVVVIVAVVAVEFASVAGFKLERIRWRL